MCTPATDQSVHRIYPDRHLSKWLWLCVGFGITYIRLFYHSALMGDSMSNIDDLAISMGLFLQKTNIIRE